MNVTILRMLSTNSLAAFSSATITSPVQKPASLRLVRDQVPSPGSPPGAPKSALPKDLPALAPPRGSLLNLSV